MMEMLNTVSSTQFLLTGAAVAVVLVCAALVFMFGFRSLEQPQFDKLPLIVDDRKSSNKKRKTKEKKSSPNRTSGEDVKAKESTKKSPVKEKKEKEEKLKEEKVKEDKPKPKKEERPAEQPKPVKKEKEAEPKKGKKKGGAVNDADKPADFDDGVWQEVPKKSDKKKEKPKEKPEEAPKKESNFKTQTLSPSKRNHQFKKGPKDKELALDADEYKYEEPEIDEPEELVIKVISVKGPNVDEDVAKALQKQVEELQRVLQERERQEQAALGGGDDTEPEEIPEVKDNRATKNIENKEKQKKKAIEAAAKTKAEPLEKDSDSDKAEDQPSSVPVFDELGDTWTETKVTKKGKKKVRKDL